MLSRNLITSSKRIVIISVIVLLTLLSNVPIPEVAAVTPTVKLTEWPVPSTSASPWGIAVDASAKIWFTENETNKIGMLDPAINKFYEWNVPGGGNPRYIFLKTVSISGSFSTRAYFTEINSDKVAFFDNNTNRLNTFREWQLDSNSKPVGIYVDENDDVWFTESGRDVIGKLTPDTNQLTEWLLPDAGNLKPWGIYVQVVPTAGGTNRFIWFTLLTGNKIGRLEANSNRLTLFDLSGLGNYQPMDIAVDSQSNAIFSNVNSNRISVLGNTTTTVMDYTIPTSASKPTSVRLDPVRKAVWFTEYEAGNIAFVNRTVTRTPTLVSSPTCTIQSGRSPICLSGTRGSRTLSDPNVSQANPAVNTQNPGSVATLSVLNSLNGVTEYRLPNQGSRPNSVALDSIGNLWFTESDVSVNRIARVQVIIPPDFKVSASPTNRTISKGQSAAYTLTVTQISGSSLPVQLSVNNPASLSANFNPQSGTPSPSFTSTLTLGSTAATPIGNYTLTLTASNANITHTVPIALNVQTIPLTAFDFSIAVVGPASANITQGGSASFDFQVALASGDPQSVALSVAGFPTGVTYSFSSDSGLPPFTSTVNVQTDVNTRADSYPVTITASGGSKSHDARVTLRIAALPRDFNVTASSYVVQVVQASQKSLELTVQSMGVFQDPVSFTATISPSSAMTVSFSPASTAPPAGGTATVQMLIVAPRDVPTGGYAISVAATSDIGTRQLTITVSVTGCLIATATYGSEVAPEVQLLRDFRDFQIARTFAGSNFLTAFNAWYYSFSPAVAQYEYHNPAARTVMKFILYPLIGILHVSSASYSLLAFEPELAALTAGIVASSLMGVVYLALPMSGVLWLARRRLQKGSERRIAKGLTGLLIALIFGFIISEVLGAAVVMMVVSAAIVLTVLILGSLLPAFEIVEFARRKI